MEPPGGVSIAGVEANKVIACRAQETRVGLIGLRRSAISNRIAQGSVAGSCRPASNVNGPALNETTK